MIRSVDNFLVKMSKESIIELKISGGNASEINSAYLNQGRGNKEIKFFLKLKKPNRTGGCNNDYPKICAFCDCLAGKIGMRPGGRIGAQTQNPTFGYEMHGWRLQGNERSELENGG